MRGSQKIYYEAKGISPLTGFDANLLHGRHGKLAERLGFEPRDPLVAGQSLSRRLRSTVLRHLSKILQSKILDPDPAPQ